MQLGVWLELHGMISAVLAVRRPALVGAFASSKIDGLWTDAEYNGASSNIILINQWIASKASFLLGFRRKTNRKSPQVLTRCVNRSYRGVPFTTGARPMAVETGVTFDPTTLSVPAIYVNRFHITVTGSFARVAYIHGKICG